MYGLWLETRRGFWLVLGVVVSLVLATAATDLAAAWQWQRLLHGPLFVTLAAATMAFADAGMAPTAPARASVLYTLSLPVSRRRIVLGRALMGLAQAAVVVAGACLLLWALSIPLRSALGPLAMARYAALVLGGQLVFLAFRVLLSTRWGPIASFLMAVMAFEVLLVARLSLRGPSDPPLGHEALGLLFPLLAPRPAASLALCSTLAATLVALAVRRVQGRDF